LTISGFFPRNPGLLRAVRVGLDFAPSAAENPGHHVLPGKTRRWSPEIKPMRALTSSRRSFVSLAQAALGLLFANLLAGVAPGQAPATIPEGLLKGVIDFHVHSAPDIFTRSVTDVEIAQLARAQGMGALVFKNHFTQTADRAWLAERLTGQICYGGIALNRAVGGLNAEAVRRLVLFPGGKGKVVWLPTFDAEHHARVFQETTPVVPVVRDGQPVPELQEIFSLIAKHDLVLGTGHSSATECLILLKAAREAGVRRMLVSHAMADPIGMTTEQMQAAAALGAKLECVWASNLQGPKSHLAAMRKWRHVSTADYAKAFRAIGVEHFLLASDLGQFLNPVHTDGMTTFLMELKAAGFSDAELDQMARRNPGWLLGLVADPVANNPVANNPVPRNPAPPRPARSELD